MAEVTIKYKDAAIATMDASGTKTLQTQGKYCEDDIEVVYARPSGGGGINKVTGSFTPSENISHFEVTGLDNPPIVVLVLIHDASNTAIDGTVKCLGGIFAYGDSVILQTNSAGTGYGRDQNNSLIPTWLDNYIVYPDGEIAPTATIIATETGFAFKTIAAANYYLKTGYTYDWVAYTYPTT